MSFRSSGPARPPAGRAVVTLPRWPRHLLPAVAVLAVTAVVAVTGAGVWTDYLWFGSVHAGTVFGVVYGTRWAMFFVAGFAMAAAIWLNAAIAFRVRPPYTPVPPPPGPGSCRAAVDAHRRLVLGLALAVAGVISGGAAAGAWRTWLLFADQVSFGRADPQFGIDISFFVFTYPFIRLVLGFLFAAVAVSLAAAVAVHILYGGLRWQGRRLRASAGAQAHLFWLLGVFVLLKGVAYWFDRYAIDFSQQGTLATGASYTDVNAVLPAKTVLAVIAVLCALLFFAGAVRHNGMLPAVGFCLLVLSAVLVGGVYPEIIQQFVVQPNGLQKEAPYIQREITATRQAYGVSGVRVRNYPGASTEPASQLAAQAAAQPGIRLADPAVVSRSFQQLQQVKGYYQFPAMLSVDRYLLPGGGKVPQDLVVAARGMGGPPPGQDTWVNEHLVYTHGFGIVAAKADAVGADGTPDFVESDIPPRGALGSFQPRVYFGPQENTYAIVGGPPGRGGQELDYPAQNSGGQQDYTYRGGGGVGIGSPLNRLLYAVKFRQLNILLSGAINSYSKILYDRQPLQRVAKVAPFLTLDGNCYPVVADHRIVWVVDGYTTSDFYPYSERIDPAQATSTSQDPGGSLAGLAPGQINYLRNSVKAVVDAYTGAVTLYQWGPPDPLLRTWMKAFPGLIQPASHIPGWLLPHLRYPPDQLEVQRQILATYHVTSPQAFYGGQDFWSVPADPAAANPGTLSQPPYYLTLTMPGHRQPEFSLTTTFAPRGRASLAAFMAVDSNPAQPGFGTIEILQLPQDTAIPGPAQVQNSFETFARASIELTQLRRGGSQVTLGNLITLPVGGGLLYIEPVYVSAASPGASGSYPTLQRVFAYYGGRPDPVGYGATLQQALSQVFGPVQGQAPPPSPVPGTGSASAAVRAYLKLAQQYYQQAQSALGKGDFASYGKALAAMKQALDQAQQAAQG